MYSAATAAASYLAASKLGCPGILGLAAYELARPSQGLIANTTRAGKEFFPDQFNSISNWVARLWGSEQSTSKGSGDRTATQTPSGTNDSALEQACKWSTVPTFDAIATKASSAFHHVRNKLAGLWTSCSNAGNTSSQRATNTHTSREAGSEAETGPLSTTMSAVPTTDGNAPEGTLDDTLPETRFSNAQAD